MRIAIASTGVFPEVIGGMERHTTALANHLVDRGISVDVFTIQNATGGNINEHRFPKTYLGPYRRLPNLLKSYLFSRDLRKFLQDNGWPDVLYGQDLALWQCVNNGHTPCVTNPFGIEPFKAERNSWVWLRSWLRRKAMVYTATNSDTVISLGGKLSGEVEHFLKVPLSKIEVIPNAVELGRFDNRSKERNLQKDKIPNSFLFVGRLARNKGIDILLQAFSALPSCKDGKLFLIGDGALRGYVTKVADPKRITFLGRVSDEELSTWYHRVEAFVFPTLYEGMPTAILEAMANQLPIIASDVGAISTMVTSSNGVLISPGNVDELVDAICRLLEASPEVKRGMGQCSLEIVERNFTWDKVTDKTIRLFRALLND